MAKPLTKLNHRHVAYILFRIGGYSNQETADLLGYSVNTCINWGKDKLIREFRLEVEEDIRGAARDYLDHLLPEILFTMAEIMRSGNSERIRLDAAARLLDKALPAETVAKIQGDPNAPILHALLKTDEDKAIVDRVADLSPDQKTEFAAAIEKLELLANSTASEPSDTE
jgi:hypothetical protein